MSSLTRADILSLPDFAAARQQHLAQVLAHQAMRRVAVGPNMTLLFENRTTMRWQIHEMCRVEGLEGAAIDHEVQTYDALRTTADSLGATLLIEYAEPTRRDAMLHALLGLHQHFALVVGDPKSSGLRAPARFDEEQFNDTRVSSVQFIRFPLSQAMLVALADLSQPAGIVVDHPAYQATVQLTRATRGALLDDLEEARG